MMKIYKIAILLILSTTFSTVYSQCDTVRYEKPLFNSITQHVNVKYGEAQRWNIPYNDEDLYMNIFTPDNDTLSKRPLMIWVHPGGFLNGSKELQDMMALCDSFAQRGYVTATIDYRKGFNPLSNTSAERAVYRGTQDLRSAIRFLKAKHNLYGIDTNYTFIGGSSAGAFAVIHTVYMNQNEAPSSIASGFGYPALGCLDCTGNNYVHGMNISGYVNLWGAIGDSTWINANETAKGLHIHGKADGTVPFGVGHPFAVPTTPITHGSRSITNKLSALNIPHTKYFVDGQGHEFHGTSNGDWNNPPTPYWDTIYNLIEDHYISILRKNTFPIQGNDLACINDTLTYRIATPNNYKICWEVINGTLLHAAGDSAQIVFSNAGNAEINVKQFTEIAAYNGTSSLSVEVTEPIVDFIGTMNGMSVSFNSTPTGFDSYQWDFGDGNSSNLENPTHSYSNAGIYTVVLNVADTNGCHASLEKTLDFSTLDVLNNELTGLKIYPNPTRNLLNITSENDLKTLVLYSSQGQIIKTIDVQGKSQQIDMAYLNSGIYFLKVIDVFGSMNTSLISVEN
ncbi:MAG TPA: PKD domain-containing protein [Brumimicrobium sp.]|nr:PKD domain-containing protein [Brumimicrobium sp.]